MRHIISILVENEAGRLSRISNMFSARGYNIESLTWRRPRTPRCRA
jgi:acetolactate synthase-1/3 small subunit